MDCVALAFEVALMVEQRVPFPGLNSVGHVRVNNRIDLAAIRPIGRLLETISVGDNVRSSEVARCGIFHALRPHTAQG